MKTLAPVNQKSVYHSAGDVYAKIMNDEIPSTNKSVDALKALTVMNTSYIAELKRQQLELQMKESGHKIELRIIETKNFDNIPIEDKKE